MKEPKGQTVAIHQPNFLPWIGYFHKMNNCDIFVFHDDVFINWTGNTRRIQIRNSPNSNDMTWINVPIDPGYKHEYIDRIELPKDPAYYKEILDQIKGVYSGTKYYKQVFPVIKRCIIQDETNLALYNKNATLILAKLFGITPKIIMSSELNVPGKGQEKILNIIKKLGDNIYLSGMGALSYQVAEVFDEHNVKLKYLDSNNDLGEVRTDEPDLLLNASVIDCLFIKGKDWVKETLQNLKTKHSKE